MKIDFQSQTPIFLQVSQGLEDEILSGIYGEEEQIPSITEQNFISPNFLQTTKSIPLPHSRESTCWWMAESSIRKEELACLLRQELCRS